MTNKFSIVAVRKKTPSEERGDPILEEAARILASATFAKADRSKRFLQFIVEKSLAGEIGSMKEEVIALEVFGKPKSSASGRGSSVRSGANRLRRLLALYYANEGAMDAIKISMPLGHYLPIFETREKTAIPATFTHTQFRHATLPFVGRQHELSELSEHALAAYHGRASLVCIVAEPGVGKTSLMDAFLTQYPGAQVGKGQSRLQFQSGQPYQVWLDVLAALAHCDPSVREHLRIHAPHWFDLLQGSSVPSNPASANVLRREMEQFLGGLAAADLRILVLDDLHWADSATIELLGHLMPAISGLKVVILAAYRPADMKVRHAPFLRLQQELSMHRLCHVVALPALSRADVLEYLDTRFPNHRIGASIVDSLCQASGGNALCVADMVDHAIKREWLVDNHGAWTFTAAPSVWRSELPTSVSAMAAKKLQELDEGSQDLLWKCSLQGVVFDSGVMTRALQTDRRGLERHIKRLSDTHHLVTPVYDHVLPFAGIRYEFSHVLYFDALQANKRDTDRPGLSARVAEAVIDTYGVADDYVGPVVARLFEDAGIFSKARLFLLRIAARAASLSAFREVMNGAQHALSLALERPANDEDLRCEMDLLLLEAIAGAALHGYEYAAIDSLCKKAGRIASKLGDSRTTMRIALLQWGLTASSNFARGLTLSKAVVKAARSHADREFAANGGLATGVSLIHQGRFGLAAKTLARTYDEWSKHSDDHEVPGVSVSIAIALLCNWARALWFVGFPAQALEKVLKAAQVARDSRRPKNIAYSSALVADLYHLCRGVGNTILWADRAIEVAKKNEFAHELSWSVLFKASAITEGGNASIGRDLADDVLRTYEGPCRAKFGCHQAWSVGVSGDPARGLEIVEATFRSGHDRFETYYDSELIRVRGELILLLHKVTSSKSSAITRIFRKAVSLARSQGSKVLELRGLTSLLRFDVSHAPRAAKRDGRDLRRAIAAFPEDADTADLRDAKECLLRAECI